MKIVLPDRIDASEEYKKRISLLDATLYEDMPSEEELITRIKDAEIITTNYVRISSKAIKFAKNLQYIIVTGVGYNQVDVDYAASKGITTLNCPTFNSQAVAEHAISLLMAVNRNLLAATIDVRTGKWKDDAHVNFELTGKKVGLIGYGNIGTRIKKLTDCFGMKTSYINSTSSFEDIDELMTKSDFIIVCAPLTPNTTKLVDERRIGMMKKTSVIVNVGRGEIIDQAALFDALKNNKIRGAGLDVFSKEPLNGAPSNEIIELANLSNVVATPHVAYFTEEMHEKQGVELLANIMSCIDGAPINVVRQADTAET